jgi:hypothetical protein
MKSEYDLTTMKRRGHPLREKVSRGEIMLTNPLDIPNWEAKISVLSTDERMFINEFFESFQNEKKPLKKGD